ncbi:MAG TPA: 50S ribosomal protein L9 [Acidimicrobiales bacterium]|nr:50S ribosomal protein L9 [Acidimicrobiales bacterium]
MKVVLRSDVSNVGNKGDVLDVADGYARNFLVPRGLAFKAAPGAIAQAADMRRARDLRHARDRASAEEVATRLAPKVISIPAKAGAEGRLFGSVTAAEVVAAVEAQAGVTLERRRLHLDEPIKTVGVHEVAVRLHPDVELRLNVEVVAAPQ